MIAGLNVRVNIFRRFAEEDDDVGGAVITGVLVYGDVEASIQHMRAQEALIGQGIETSNVFTALVGRSLDVQEGDYLTVSFPHEHAYYGNFFRVVGVRDSSFVPNDRRQYTMLTLDRIERARNVQ